MIILQKINFYTVKISRNLIMKMLKKKTKRQRGTLHDQTLDRSALLCHLIIWIFITDKLAPVRVVFPINGLFFDWDLGRFFLRKELVDEDAHPHHTTCKEDEEDEF